MGTRSPKRTSTTSKTKQHSERSLKARISAVEVVPAGKQRRHSKRKPYSFAPRDDFVKHIPYLDEVDAANLDKLRDDLQGSIERVVRVQHAFVKALNRQASKSNRIKSIAQVGGEIPFHCDLQIKIASQVVTTIIESKAALAKQRAEEAAAKKREDHVKNCISCFASLDVGGMNYIVWSLETKNNLCAGGLGNAIDPAFGLPTGTSTADEMKRKGAAHAVCLLLRHLHQDLKFNYLEEQNPAVIWNSLKLRFDTDREQAMLPLLNDEWNKLCFYNFKTVTEYATKLYSIASELSWCGRKLSEPEKIEKTLTTFNPAERILSMQYRRMNHDTFDNLVAALLLDEKDGLLLQRNHDERRLPGNPSDHRQGTPEVHYDDASTHGRGGKSKLNGKRKWKQNGGKHQPRGKRKFAGRQGPKTPNSKDECRKCGLRGHWANKCNTAKFHCKLYQQTKAASSKPVENKSKRGICGKKTTFMTNFSDDSDVESYCVESYSNAAVEDGTYCLIDCATTHVILTDKRFFVNLKASRAPRIIKTVGGDILIARGTGRVQVVLPNGTVIDVANAIYAPTSSRNLLSYADLRKNGLHIHMATTSDGDECLRLFDCHGRNVEECADNGNGLYFTHIKPTSKYDASFCAEEDQVVMSDAKTSKISLWHDRLGHPGRGMLQKMTKVVQSIPLKSTDIPKHGQRLCPSCAMGKLQSRKKTALPAQMYNPHSVLEMLVSDVCGPISPLSGPFNYYMVVKDTSARFSKVQLLTSRNEVMPKLLASIIQLKVQFPDHPIKNLRVDNASEYVSKSFQEFCTSTGINLETSVPYAHNTNAENFVKQIQMAARPLLLRSNLPLSCWGHAVVHAGDLIRYRPSVENDLSPYELVHGFAPSVSHLKIFGSAVYVPTPPHQRAKMGPRRQLAIYVGFQSPSIIRYLNPQTGDLFTAHTTMCEFDETSFPKMRDDDGKPRAHFDFEQPETKEVHKDPYNDQGRKGSSERVTRSELNEAKNYPARVAVDSVPATTGAPPNSKRGRPKGAKDLVPRKRRSKAELAYDSVVDEPTPKVNASSDSLAEVNVSASLALHDNEPEPQTIQDCKSSPDWPIWKAAIKAELRSLLEREVFGSVQECPPDHKPIGCRWIFNRKRDQTGKVARFKARLVAQGFTQRFGIDYSDTYSPVMTMTTFRWLLAFAARNGMKVKQADIETAYLYGVIDVELYMRVPEGLRVEGEKPRKFPCVRVHKSLYGLKQAGRIWYMHFSQYLIKCGFRTHECSPCLFIKRSGAEIAIIGIYVDDIVMVGTDAAVAAAMTALKAEFKVKDLGIMSFSLGIQVRQISTGIVLHQANYIAKQLERFSMREVSRATKTPMVVRNLKPESDVYGPRCGSEKVLGEQYPYREAIGALLYLANCSRPDIAFAVSVLARYSSEPTKRHWSGIKQLLRYLAKTKDYGLLYRRGELVRDVSKLVTDDIYGFADAGYLSDPHKTRSQTGYVFMSAHAAISWKSTKQTLAATSTNQSELIALYEASRECVWLRLFIEFIRQGLRVKEKLSPIIIYDDNSACVAQVQQGYIKSDRTKHIDPKFFFMHDLNEKQLEVKRIASDKNLADLFTKTLGSNKHWDLMHGLGMIQL